MKYILPTSDLVRQFKPHERLFNFYEDGIKGLIRDTILLSAAYRYHLFAFSRYNNSQYAPRPTIADGLLEKVLRDYDNSLDAHLERFQQNTNSSYYVETVVKLIDHAVGEMMADIFQSTAYDVSKTDWQWHGSDLVARVNLYPESR